MDARQLAVDGVVEFTPRVFADDRGLLVTPFHGPTFRSATGRSPFRVAQTIHSESRRGVVRGVHVTATPPGSAKYIYCVSGSALDITVDLRVGSPTFGISDTVLLDQRDFRAVYVPPGVGHAFVALTDGTVMSYLVSSAYQPDVELALSAVDPELALPIPANVEPMLSERDRLAPTLAEARARGLLPGYRTCRDVERSLLVD